MRCRRRCLLTVCTFLVLLGCRTVVPAAAGDPDLSFYGQGWTVWPGAVQTVNAMTVQPDGKPVLAGLAMVAGSTVQHIGVWRLHPDGSRDLSFNGTGMALLPTMSGHESAGYAVALDPQGGIVVAGTSWTFGYSVLTRFLPDGQLDMGFGSGGYMYSLYGTATCVAVQPDGKILTAGTGNYIARHLPGGGPDRTFGHPLYGTADLGGISRTVAIALQSDGKILIGADTSPGAVIMRVLPNGTKDTGFAGGTGFYRPELSVTHRISSITVREDGFILAGGDWAEGFTLLRLRPDGTPDTAWNSSATPGYTRVPFGVNANPTSRTMIVQNDGGILLTGSCDLGPFPKNAAIARITAAGPPDPAFGSGGFIYQDLSQDHEEFNTAALVADDRLLLAGTQNPAGPPGSPGGGLFAQRALLARIQTPPAWSLETEYPSGTILRAPPSAPVDFGPVTAGTGFMEITLRNAGRNTLTGLQAAITGQSVPGDYHASPPAATTLAPGAQTTVVVSLTPSAVPGTRTATLRLTAGNADPSLPPRLISLTGSKATPYDTWRVIWFGSAFNSGAGADTNDFDQDGLPNFMEYATRSHPHQYSAYPCQPAGEGAFTYTRPGAALTEFSFIPESAPSLDGPWSAAGLTSAVLTDDEAVQTVRVTSAGGAPASRLFLRLRVTKL